MSLDPAELEATVRRGDAPAVRQLLRDAPEAERAACAKALRSFLRGPEFFMPDPVMLGPDQFLRFMRSGFQDKPDGIIDQEREEEERNRGYNAWREIANGLAFQAAAFGLAGGVAAAVRLAQDFPLRYWDNGPGGATGSPARDTELVAQVLADRRPAWLADFTDRHLRQFWGIAAWPLARKLVRLGAIPRPAIAEYTTLMPAGLAGTDPGYTGYRDSSRGPAELLLADPDLLEDEVWRLFTVPEAATALEKHDRWVAMPDDSGAIGTATWSRALARLAADGHLDRDRLLDACLGAFTRDFNPNRVTWYATLLEQLAPSEAETAVREATFRVLLAARSKAGVTIGQRALRRLVDAGSADVGPLLGACAPALLFKQKSIATAQLKLIQKAVTLRPACAGDAAAAVAIAFGHERQDVQEAALKLIGKLGVPAGEPLAEIRRRAADLSPNLIPQAVALGLLDAPADHAPADHASADDAPLPGQAAIEARIGSLPAAAAEDLTWALTVARAGEVPGPARVEPQAGAALPAPVTDPDELIALLAMLIEDAGDALAAERALAGAVRLSELPREQRARIAAPVLKRAQQIMRGYDPFVGDLITSDLALITHVWAGEELPEADGTREIGSYKSETYAVSGTGRALTMAGIFSARAWEAARLIEAGRGGVLLAEPETERGAITAPALLARVRELGRRRGPVSPYDRDVALLRLAPGPAGELWDELGRLLGRPAGALRETHRLVRLPVRFEPVCGLPLGRPIRHSNNWHQHLLARTVGTAPAAPECASWQLLTALSDPLADHVKLYGPSRFELRHYDAAVAAWALICPWQPEVAAAHLLRPLSDGLISGLTPATTAIASIRHPGHPLGPVGHLALVTGLSSDAGDTRIAAAQLWTQACSDGRLDARLAAEAVVSGVTGNALKLGRIADSLRHASHTALGAYRVVETVCLAAEGFSPNFPAGMHALFELAAGLGSKVGVPELPVAIREVAAKSGSTRVVTTARQLVRSASAQAPDRGAAIEQALAAVLGRADADEK